MVDGGPIVAISLHYSRGGRQVSLRRSISLAGKAVAGRCRRAGCASGDWPQYPGQITKKDKTRRIARRWRCWSGPAKRASPRPAGLSPSRCLTARQLQDGGVYLARPEPMAVDGGVEYVLQKDGKRMGLFDIDSSGQEQGSWVGLGSWKPMPKPKVKPAPVMAQDDMDDAGSDRPVLHRKHPATSGSSGSGAGTAPADPDRPTLHKKTSDDGSGEFGRLIGADPDRPTLHKPSNGDDSNDDTASAPAPDPDRPRLNGAQADQRETITGP